MADSAWFRTRGGRVGGDSLGLDAQACLNTLARTVQWVPVSPSIGREFRGEFFGRRVDRLASPEEVDQIGYHVVGSEHRTNRDVLHLPSRNLFLEIGRHAEVVPGTQCTLTGGQNDWVGRLDDRHQ